MSSTTSWMPTARDYKMFYNNNKNIDQVKFWTVRLPRYRTGQHTNYTYNGRFEVHKFYLDRSRDNTPPSWFVEGCSREKAEDLLRTALARNYGNTLMRESTRHIHEGSYVITKIVRNSRTKNIEYEHFQICRVEGGYKLEIENIPQKPMRCLDDVMKFFLQIADGDTRPLVTNDLQSLGVMTNDPYSVRIARNSVNEPPPDYDEVPEMPTNTAWQHRSGSATVSPGMFRGNSNRAELENLNNVINGFEPVEEHYYNVGSRPKRASIRVSDARAPPAPIPPPPTPHDMGQQPGYLNEEVDPLHALPVAPPPPRHPIGNDSVSSTRSSSSSSRSSVRPSQSFSSGQSSPRETKSKDAKPSDLELQLSQVRLRSTGKDTGTPSSPLQSPGGNTSTQSPQSRNSTPTTNTQLKNFHVPKGVTSPKSPNTPSAFPVWNTPKQSSDSVTRSNVSLHNANNNGAANTPNGKTSIVRNSTNSSVVNGGSILTNGDISDSSSSSGGVDETTPGKVGAIISRFSSAPQTPTPTKSPKPVKKGPVGRSWSMYMPPSSYGGHEDGQVYEVLPDEPEDPTPTYHNSPTNTTVAFRPLNTSYSRQRSSSANNASSCTDDVVYDDTAVCDVDESCRSGLAPAFKDHLEKMIGGTTGHSVGSSKTLPNRSHSTTSFPTSPADRNNMPLPPVPHQSDPDEDMYADADSIQPDDITYVNDTFN